MTKEQDVEVVNDAVKSGGAFEVIKSRLTEQGGLLSKRTNDINELRKKEFGGAKNEILAKVKSRTINNCVPVDMTQVLNMIVVGYKVNVGLKSILDVSDMFSLYSLNGSGADLTLEELSLENTFLKDPKFIASFSELMNYYKGNELVQITTKNDFLYISFKIGSLQTDLKVFKWKITPDEVLYDGDRANDELSSNLKSHCFEWIKTTRKDHVLGLEPHVSILNKVFVETVGGDLTIKIEDNTEDGLGIYNEPVSDLKQVLEDAEISYAEVDSLILLNIKPYNESARYFIFNTVTQSVLRVDSLANSCHELPDQHGLIFPNGYYLSNGDYKLFENESSSMKFSKFIKSPNGEDFLYVFFDSVEKNYVLYSYNLIRKELDNPIHANGYSVYPNGNIAIFRHSDNLEASKIHPLTIWKTPFFDDEFFLEIEKKRDSESRDKELLNIGNSDLVSGISDLFTIINFIKKDEVSTSIFEGVIRNSNKIIDDYHWLASGRFGDVKNILKSVINTSELIIDEFSKVKVIQENAVSTLKDTLNVHNQLISKIKLTSPDKASEYVILLSEINNHIGHLITVQKQRYIDVNSVENMQNKILDEKDGVNQRLLKLLQDKKSFKVYLDDIENAERDLKNVVKVIEIEPIEKKIEDVNLKITLINSEINEIESKDSTIISVILDHVSEVFSKLNQISAKIKTVKKGFLSKEAKIEFGAQFKLLTQSVSNGLSRSTSPEKCDEEISSLISLIEKLESKFSEFDEYAVEISQKRNEINDAFEGHKQQLINAAQKRISNIVKAGEININSISNKVQKFNTIDDLNTYFSSDIIVLKVRTLISDIKQLGGTVQAEDLESKLVNVKDVSMRSLRDNQDIFEDGGKVMKMGKHKFPVNKTPLDLTILNKDGKMQSHLTSTDYFNEVNEPRFSELEHLWNADLPSESSTVYRSEYLSYLLLNDALKNVNGLTLESLLIASKDKKLIPIINSYSDSLYRDSYIKGVHDYDAELFLSALLNIYKNAGSLSYSQEIRSMGLIFLYHENSSLNLKDKLSVYKNAKQLKDKLGNSALWEKEIKFNFNLMKSIFENKEDSLIYSASEFFMELVISNTFEYSKESNVALNLFNDYIEKESLIIEFEDTLNYYSNLCLWVESVLRNKGKDSLLPYVKDAASIYFIKNLAVASENKIVVDLSHSVKDVNLSAVINGLLGDHSTIIDGHKNIILDDYISRLKYHKDVYYPSFEAFINLRQSISNSEKEKLCLNDFKSKPLTSFVRNKLITDVYLPMIGDNFAKQMGTIGESKRTDLMGLLLLISPPGYGKTTLIEYVANKLGLVFVKVNCPSIGHSTTSLDPNEAGDSTARKEINKINLAFEMGSNVLLYLDDIQHTNPELLQKFISLCDGTRRVEGVWEGKTKTYDMRGKKFAVVMAGNPYTETGEAFKIPDMLANRADIYNLGDILGGKIETFKLSYIENSLTSNSVLAPLATRGMDDVYKLIKMAQGEEISIDELDYNYSASEVNEIKGVISHMLVLQDIVFDVNMEYIKSAATSDNYRVEPIFKLQGSYRNMNKMTEKLVSIMNEKELMNLILDHYTGESQTLTSGAESNMLKLKSILGVLSFDETERWNMICSEFNRNRKMGGDGADSGKMIANQLSVMTELLDGLSKNKEVNSVQLSEGDKYTELISVIKDMNNAFNLNSKLNDEHVNNLSNILSQNRNESSYENINQIKELVLLVKENQSEDKLIGLFTDQIEQLNQNYINLVEKKDEELLKIFRPMIKYFETVLKNYDKDKSK